VCSSDLITWPCLACPHTFCHSRWHRWHTYLTLDRPPSNKQTTYRASPVVRVVTCDWFLPGDDAHRRWVVIYWSRATCYHWWYVGDAAVLWLRLRDRKRNGAYRRTTRLTWNQTRERYQLPYQHWNLKRQWRHRWIGSDHSNEPSSTKQQQV